ncbi:hemerythrin domain-containing protein [Hyphomonas sp.]|uniref:hemerythrin domain-containing protein n=1 Tax=Hyphomonas sp. TaxID=87 RepID=UPI0037C000AD
MTTIYIKLKTDHDRHRDLLKKLASTQGDSGERRKLWQAFCYDAAAHAAAEELAFYGKLIAGSEAQSEGRRSAAEHEDLGALIRGLNETHFGAPGWMARFRTLKQRDEHHIGEEEGDAFPVARDVTGADESGHTGAGFASHKKEERGPRPRKSRKRAGGLTRTVQPAVSRSASDRATHGSCPAGGEADRRDAGSGRPAP